MKNNEKNIIFYDSWWQMLSGKSAEFRHSVLDAVFAYAFDGKDASFPLESGQQIAYETICNYINQNRDKYAEKIAKAEERWKKKKNSHADAGSADAGSVDKDKDNEKENVKDNVKDKDNMSENKDKSFFSSNNSIFSAEKKEKIIFDFALFLLSSGCANAYKIACEDWEFNEATGWVKERERTDGSVEKVAIRQPLSWLKSNPRKRNQEFAPADGQLLAAILSKSGIELPANADIIDLYRGLRAEGETVHLLFARITASVARFGKAVVNHPKTKEIVSVEVRKRYPEVTCINVSNKSKF